MTATHGNTAGDRGPTAPEWAAPALDSVLTRVARTRDQVGEGFPLFAAAEHGRWTTTRRGSWTGGFWAGLLWLRARYTGHADDRRTAGLWTRRLAPWVGADTAARGLILWYGTALGDATQAAGLCEDAARACRSAFDAELGLVPWGSAFGRDPGPLARADGVPGLVPLLSVISPELSRAHLVRHLELCLGDGSVHWSWRHVPGAGWAAQDDPPPGWSRGRAWLLLALADGAHRLGTDGLTPYLPLLGSAPAVVPPADHAHPHGPRDTSAAAITAVALLKAGERERAVELLRDLVHSHLTDDGRLLDGCYDLAAGTAPRHELVWGTYFLAYALAALVGCVDPHDA